MKNNKDSSLVRIYSVTSLPLVRMKVRDYDIFGWVRGQKN
jgi:hypothetical protein